MKISYTAQENLLAILILVVVCLPLLGCDKSAEFEPSIFTKVVKVEVPVACKVKIDPKPMYPDTDEALDALDGRLGDQMKLLLQARALREAWEPQPLAALAFCAEPVGKPPLVSAGP